MGQLESLTALNLYINSDPSNCPHLKHFSRKGIIPRIVKSDSEDLYTAHINSLTLNSMILQLSSQELLKIYSKLGLMIGYCSNCFVEHSHLHTDNIIIEEKSLKPYIIDWRYSRFTKTVQLEDIKYFLTESTKFRLDTNNLSNLYTDLSDACLANFRKQQLVTNETISSLRAIAVTNYVKEEELIIS